MTTDSPPLGKVYLIGAGPGDPRLITVRGAQLLGQADVVLYDGLTNPELLDHAAGAEQICVGKHGQSRIWTQPEIIAEMIAHATCGRIVARLKGGDPAVFARTSEEVEALVEAQISFEIVPGITAALAAGSYAGIPVTDRNLASAVALVTGHEQPGKAASALDWQALAQFPGTLVVYMGVTTAESWTGSLIDAGKPPETPTALIRRCSYPDQKTVHCRLDEVATHLTPASEFRPPVIIVIGPVTELASTMNWIERRPLFGQTILVTRPADQAAELALPLGELGANVILEPAITIGPPEDWQEVDRAIESLARFDQLVFCSRNGVTFFLDRMLQHAGRDLRNLPASIACVGRQTAEVLREQYNLIADIVPSDYRADSLADLICPTATGQRVLIIRASRGRDVLARRLTESGAAVTEVAAYSHQDVHAFSNSTMQLASSGKIDWITVTSSATAENIHRILGDSMSQSKIASLSPVTTQTLADLGIEVAAEAEQATIAALVEKITNVTHPSA